jgi:hypothetical protein
VTKELGLPDDLQAEKVFVHKTANYENVVVIQEGQFKAYSNAGEIISSFPMSGEVSDIISLGNTIIVLTSESVNYVLFRGGKYISLGADIPFPKLKIEAKGESGKKSVTIDLDDIGLTGDYRAFSSLQYGEYLNSGINADEGVVKILSKIKEQKAVMSGELGRKGAFWGPVYVMYGVTLYNGTVITTVPELICRDVALPYVWGLTLSSKFTMNGANKEFQGGIDADIEAPAFTLGVSAEEDYHLADWKDIIQSVDVYVSLPIDTAPDYRRIEIKQVTDTDTTNATQTRTATTNWGILKENEQILGEGNFYRVKSYELSQEENDTISKLFFTWNSQDYDVSGESLVESIHRLPSTSVDHVYVDALKVRAEKALQYNEQVLLSSASNLLQYRGVVSTRWQSSNWRYTARLKFILSDGGVIYSEEGIQLPSSGFLSFASTKATSVEMIVRLDRKKYTDQDWNDYDIETTYSYLKLPMNPHPSMPCAYAKIELGKSLEEYAFEKNGSLTLEQVQKVVDFNVDAPYYLSLDNKLLVSSASNPFVYPETKRITFQSKVLGVAVSTTALSQGQFGQFPLYVFTEDGIWAMETAADGSFVTSKPLSRDVCVNPDSITSIDNAVVFVTDKGVMLLQGSQVVNISPNMNGRHYTIEETAKVILEKTIEDTIAKISKTPVDQMAQVIQNEVSQSISQQETRASIERTAQSIIAEEEFFKDLLPILSDSTHFMAFVREATIAYDYPGQRLVFIKKDEKYQYVYKLDTQTWHKTAYGIDLLAPINSYPECMVQGQKKKEVTRTFWKVVEYYSQEEFDYLAGRIRVKMPELSDREIQSFLDMDGVIDVTGIHEDDREWLANEMDTYNVATEFEEKTGEESFTCIYDLSTILDAADSRIPTRGVIATRPFDLGAPDVLKTITDIKIRGQYARGAVKFMLLGSMDGINFYVIGTKRGKAWKLFRLIILADLDPTERISWVDVIYEEKFTNRLR